MTTEEVVVFNILIWTCVWLCRLQKVNAQGKYLC